MLTGQPHPGNDSRECLRSAEKNKFYPVEESSSLLQLALEAMALEHEQRATDCPAIC